MQYGFSEDRLSSEKPTTHFRPLLTLAGENKADLAGLFRISGNERRIGRLSNDDSLGAVSVDVTGEGFPELCDGCGDDRGGAFSLLATPRRRRQKETRLRRRRRSISGKDPTKKPEIWQREGLGEDDLHDLEVEVGVMFK